ncbi:hypothetical protein D3C77_444290 [compost metagenome]
MEYKELMEYKGIFFLGLIEPAENSLRLFFRRSITSSTPEPILIGDNNIGDGYAVTIDEKSPVIQIDFNSYVGYSVLNESFTVWDDIVNIVSTEKPVVMEVSREKLRKC